MALLSPRVPRLPLASHSAGAGALLQLMRDGQPRTRAELIQLTGLARSTVGARVESLLAAGLLVPAGESRSTGGRPPTRLAFNPEAGFVIGADLGATHATVALTDLRGTVVAETSEELDIRGGPEVVLDALGQAAPQHARDVLAEGLHDPDDGVDYGEPAELGVAGLDSEHLADERRVTADDDVDGGTDEQLGDDVGELVHGRDDDGHGEAGPVPAVPVPEGAQRARRGGGGRAHGGLSSNGADAQG